MNRHVSDRRLLKLAAFLRTLPPKRFNYASWVGRDWKGAEDLSCGTTACALGWAAAMPAFRRLGLQLKKDRDGHGWVTLRGQRRRRWYWDKSILAGSAVFGLTVNEARFLFLPDEPLVTPDGRWLSSAPSGGARPKTVAAHIERFVHRRAKGAL